MGSLYKSAFWPSIKTLLTGLTLSCPSRDRSHTGAQRPTAALNKGLDWGLHSRVLCSEGFTRASTQEMQCEFTTCHVNLFWLATPSHTPKANADLQYTTTPADDSKTPITALSFAKLLTVFLICYISLATRLHWIADLSTLIFFNVCKMLFRVRESLFD